MDRWFEIIHFNLLVFVLVIIANETCALGTEEKLPPCVRYQDTYGSWVNTSSLQKRDYERHFYGPKNKIIRANTSANAALDFTEMWLPHRCSYHRFTNATLHQCATYHILKQKKSRDGDTSSSNPRQYFHLSFFGDSALRGIVCGLSRLLTGTERFGPLSNPICGESASGRPITFHDTNQCKNAIYGSIKISFCYIVDFVDRLQQGRLHTPEGLLQLEKDKLMPPLPQVSQLTRRKRESVASLLKSAIAMGPYAIIVNSGAWDFDKYARAYNSSSGYPNGPSQYGSDHGRSGSNGGEHHDDRDPLSKSCSAGEVGDIVRKKRTEPAFVRTMLDLAMNARAVGIRPIYRNNHFNLRYSAYCADEKLENLLSPSNRNVRNSKSAWEIWDNRNISLGVFRQQNWDGFHFDRHRTYTEEQHREKDRWYRETKGCSSGMLEMQLTQSLLQSVCSEFLEYMWQSNSSVEWAN